MPACLQCPNQKIEARGLCARCYVRTKNQVRRGKTTWKALFAAGKGTKPFSGHLTARIVGYPWPYHVRWRDAQGRQRQKDCGHGPAGIKAAEELKRRIEEDRHQPFRPKQKADRSQRIRIPTPAGLVLISDVEGKMHLRDAQGVEWQNAKATEFRRRLLQDWEDQCVHLGYVLTTSTYFRIINGRRHAEVIYLTTEIDHCRKSIADRAQGIYTGTPINGKPVEQDCITLGGLARLTGMSISNLNQMQDDKLLTPILFHNKGGFRDKPRSPRITYIKADALAAVENWKKIWRQPKKGKRRGGGFPGLWDDGMATVEMASTLTKVPGYTILWMIQKGILPKPAKRKPPAPYHPRERFVVDPGQVRKKHKWLKGIRKKVDEKASELKLQANQRSELFKAFLTGKSFADFLKDREATEPANVSSQLPEPDQPARLESSRGDEPTLSKIDQAILIYSRDASLTVRAVAKMVKCSPSTLSGSDAFQRLRDAQTEPPPKGRKSRDGNIDV